MTLGTEFPGGYAYLDANGVVLAVSTVQRSLSEVKAEGVVTIVEGAPAGLKVKIDGHWDATAFHQLRANETGQALEDYDEVPHLAALKERRYLEIDAVDEHLIDFGYEFPPNSGQVFSLSNNAQKKLLAIAAVMGFPEWIGWPIELSFWDDADGKYSIPDEATFRALAMTAFGTVNTIIDAGDALKASIRAATTLAEVEAVVDERLPHEDWVKVTQRYLRYYLDDRNPLKPFI